MRQYVVFAENKKTDEFISLGTFPTKEDAQWNIDNNIEWDEDDNPEDWELSIEEIDEDEHFYEPDLEVGFDPYLGCYTDDC